MQVWAHVHLYEVCWKSGSVEREVSDVSGPSSWGCPSLFHPVIEKKQDICKNAKSPVMEIIPAVPLGNL